MEASRAGALIGSCADKAKRLLAFHFSDVQTPGQRPFPPSGPQLKLYSRWRPVSGRCEERLVG